MKTPEQWAEEWIAHSWRGDRIPEVMLMQLADLVRAVREEDVTPSRDLESRRAKWIHDAMDFLHSYTHGTDTDVRAEDLIYDGPGLADMPDVAQRERVALVALDKLRTWAEEHPADARSRNFRDLDVKELIFHALIAAGDVRAAHLGKTPWIGESGVSRDGQPLPPPPPDPPARPHRPE